MKSLRDNSPQDAQITDRLIKILQNYYSINPTSTLWSKISTQPQTIIAKKKSDASDLISAYDFFWQTTANNLDSSEKNELENSLISALSQQTPGESSTYLTDGTKVTELIPDRKNISRNETGGLTILKSINENYLFYQLTDQGLIIGNNINWPNSQKIDSLPQQFLSLSISAIPSELLKNQLSDFQTVEYQGGLIEIY
jgi:hypothetical protein